MASGERGRGMPCSDRDGKEWAREAILSVSPSTVIDVGPGVGTYSDLARADLPGSRWAAIEAWGPYVNQFNLWDKYDHVVVSDVRHCDLHSVDVAPDLVIVADMLEHMSTAEARVVIARLQSWADNVLVAIPVVHNVQHAVDGNWFEIHRDHWSADAMRRALGPGVKDERVGEVLAYFLWSREG